MGRLTRDCEIKYTPTGSVVVSFGIAHSEKWKRDGQEQERVTFVEVEMWGKRGETFAQFHAKGDLCFVLGKLKFDQWEDRNTGQKRSKLKINACDGFEFVGGRKCDCQKSDDDGIPC